MRCLRFLFLFLLILGRVNIRSLEFCFSFEYDVTQCLLTNTFLLRMEGFGFLNIILQPRFTEHTSDYLKKSFLKHKQELNDLFDVQIRIDTIHLLQRNGTNKLFGKNFEILVFIHFSYSVTFSFASFQILLFVVCTSFNFHFLVRSRFEIESFTALF